MKLHLKLAIVMCVLAWLTPPLALASSSQVSADDPNLKIIKICNNFTQVPIRVTLSSTPVGGSELRWDTFPVASSSCVQRVVPAKYWNAGRAYIFDGTSTSFNSDGAFQLVEFTFRGPNEVPGSGTWGNGVGYNFSAVDSVYSALPLAVEATDIEETKDNSLGYTGMNLGTTQMDFDRKQLTLKFKELVDAGWPYFKNSSNPVKEGEAVTDANYYKLPGGYNLFALTSAPDGSPNISPMLGYMPAKGVSPITASTLTQKWMYWLGADRCTLGDEFCTAFQTSVKNVWNGFVINAKSNNLPPLPPLPPLPLPNENSNFVPGNDYVNMAKHITGYVNFGSNSDWVGIDPPTKNAPAVVGPSWIGLAEGVPFKGAQYEQFKYPDCNSIYSLDCYVTAIHKKFQMNVYSFSIDDSLGYFDAPTQNKLIIAVGGLNHLPNQKQAQRAPESPYNINLGLGWTKIEACGYVSDIKKKDRNTGSRTPLPFSSMDNSSAMCQVKLIVASDDGKISTEVDLTMSLNNKNLVKVACNDQGAGVCDYIVVDTHNPKTKNYIDVDGPPPPSGGGSGGDVKAGFFAYPVGYKSISSANCPLASGASTILGVGGNSAFTANAEVIQCNFEVVPVNNNVPTASVVVDVNSGKVDCTPANSAICHIGQSPVPLQIFLPGGV